MSFEDDLKRFSNKTENSIEDTIITTIFQINEKVIMATNVDTGQARGGWIASIGQPELSDENNFDEDGKPTVSKANKVAMDSPGNVYYITNSVKHIRYLEYGTDKYPPVAMVRNTVAQIKEILKKAV